MEKLRTIYYWVILTSAISLAGTLLWFASGFFGPMTISESLTTGGIGFFLAGLTLWLAIHVRKYEREASCIAETAGADLQKIQTVIFGFGGNRQVLKNSNIQDDYSD